jgi:hypothetical protein
METFMRKVLFGLLVLLMMFGQESDGRSMRGVKTASGGLDTPMGDYHLLVIGIDDYTKWPKLKGTAGNTGKACASDIRFMFCRGIFQRKTGQSA